ncbi:MAG: RDD family protein [Caulobacteraceae bacterium]|nr:RDD family protein [Caulobacteraceae bacterium]
MATADPASARAPAAAYDNASPALRRELVTPEGVDLEVRLADASERAGAFLIDLVIMGVAMIALTILVGVAAAATHNKTGGSIMIVALLLIWFLLRNFYFVAFELTPRGATPGKRLLGLRVASRNGGRLTADAIFARNAMRELEVYLPATFLFARASGVDAWIILLGIAWCAVFVFMPLFNRDKLRAGDIVAGTWVLKAPRRKLAPDMAVKAHAAAKGVAFTQRELDTYGVKELQVLEEVLRRYEPRTLKAVAERIRTKIGRPADPQLSDGAFLDAYYVALRGRLEHRLLFGRRRRDKFDAP